MDRHNQVAGRAYRNICAEYDLEIPGTKWDPPPWMVENDQTKTQWDLQIQTDKLVMANQSDAVI